MELDFIPLDYDYFDFQGENYTKIIGRTSSGKRVCLIDKCDVYMWAILKDNLNSKEIKKIQEKIQKITIENKSRTSKIIKTELQKKKFLGKNVNAIKIYTNNHKDLKKIADKLDIKGIEKRREHDIPYITRYIIEKKLIPLTWHKISGTNLEKQDFGGIAEILDTDLVIKVNKIEKTEKQKSFTPKIIAFDIETEEFEIGKGEILMISLVGDGIKKVISCKKCDNMPDYVEYYKTEKQMLEAFEKEIKKISPDILTGYFSDKFDMPYIKARADKNKLKLNLGIDSSNIKFSGGINPRIKIFGIVHIDLLQFIETAYSQYLKSETLSLNEISAELLGEKKHEHEFKQSSKMSHNEWRNFFKYNLQDSNLVYKLFLKIWPDMIEFSKVMQEPLFNISRDGMSSNVEHYIIHNLEKYNEIIEKKPTYNQIGERRVRGKYEGAFVLEPKPKLYEDIVMFDFTSMYGSIIVTYNLSLSTFKEEKQNKKTNSISVKLKDKTVYFSKKKGFFPEMLEEIIKYRKKFKAEYKKAPSPILKARSNAFKLIANAAYGYQGFFGARYYKEEAAASTAALAKKSILDTIEKIKKQKYEVIYSDTDSIAFLQGKKSKEDILKLLKNLNENLPGIMELELEDFYKRGIWVTTRKGEFGAKKKYALINEKAKMKIRGFETVRRDWCTMARNLQNKVLEKILADGNEKSALEYTKKIINQLKNREIPKKQLIIKTQLKKPLSEYKAVTPHVTIARKMLAQDLPVDQNMLIQYYIADIPGKKLVRDKAVFPDNKQEYDIDYYLNRQLISAVENIFQVFNININDVIKGNTQKTLF